MSCVFLCFVVAQQYISVESAALSRFLREDSAGEDGHFGSEMLVDIPLTVELLSIRN